MRLLVNDANILIDLIELGILPHFFALEYEFYTTDMVLGELYLHQQETLLPYIDNGELIVEEVSPDDLVEIFQIMALRPTLSDKDCSAFHQARKRQATLITSDNTLRKFAIDQQLEVHGHLWVFDQMVEAATISPKRASEKLTELCEIINPKLALPNHECSKRIRKWNK